MSIGSGVPPTFSSSRVPSVYPSTGEIPATTHAEVTSFLRCMLSVQPVDEGLPVRQASQDAPSERHWSSGRGRAELRL